MARDSHEIHNVRVLEIGHVGTLSLAYTSIPKSQQKSKYSAYKQFSTLSVFNSGNGVICPDIQVPMCHQRTTLPGLSEGGSLRPAILTLFCTGGLAPQQGYQHQLSVPHAVPLWLAQESSGLFSQKMDQHICRDVQVERLWPVCSMSARKPG